MNTKNLIVISEAGDIPIWYDRSTKYGVPAKNAVMKGLPALKSAMDAVGERCRELGWDVKSILSAGMYVDRNARGSSKKSPHASGYAIDVDGIEFQNGKFMTTDVTKDRATYLAIEAVLRRYFGVVLNRDYNKLHRDHWHCDLSRKVADKPNHSLSETLFIQRACNELGGEKLVIDGVYGTKTATALHKHAPNGTMAEFLTWVEGHFPKEKWDNARSAGR